MMALLLIFVMLLMVLCLNLNKNQQVKQGHDRSKDVEIMEPLKYLSNF